MQINNNNQAKLLKLKNLKLQQEEEKKEEKKVEEQKQPEKQVDLKKAETLKEGKTKLEAFLKQEEVQSAPRKIPVVKNPTPLKPNVGGNIGKINAGVKINRDDSESLQISEKMRERINNGGESNNDSAIRDDDIAKEMTQYNKSIILQKAAEAANGDNKTDET